MCLYYIYRFCKSPVLMCQSDDMTSNLSNYWVIHQIFTLREEAKRKRRWLIFSYSEDIMTAGVLHFFQLQPDSCLLYHQEPPASAQQPVSACQRKRWGAGWHRISRCGGGGEPHYKIIKAIMNFACKWICAYWWLVSNSVWCHLEPTLLFRWHDFTEM